MTRQLRRLLLTTLATAAMVLGLGLAPQTTVTTLPTAQAADLSGFDPGMIITDALFYDSGTMSAAQVQSFLATKGANCSPAAGNTCIKDYRQPTISRAADSFCSAYTGSSSETAAQIIAKVSAACGINPQVLIVTLQKEQGLITATAGKSQSVYNKALGFACPDTAPCDAAASGFGTQVYLAAKQFKRYAANPSGYAHRPGVVNNVRYHPTVACGTSPVFIQNQATASLYNYTPYQPNSAALAAGYGTGDSCSSYGNRNFWNYFTDWFGSTAQRLPIGVLENVTTPSVGTIAVSGWALDPDTTASINVHVYVDGKSVASLKADGNRPDVGSAYGKGNAHGFSGTVKASGGTHQVCVWAIDSSGGANPQIGCKTVTVVNQAPFGSLDSVTSSSSGTLRVTGWALDPDTTASIQVHVYVDGKAAASVTANGTRNDVATAYGKGAAHGYDATVGASAGIRQVCIYAIDPIGGTNPRIGCKSVTVDNKAPIGSFDSGTSVQGELRVRGWALDPDTTDSTRVHVYVDGKATASVLADQTRQDVANAYGKGAAHGYDVTLPASVGNHEVCVYGIDATGGASTRLGCRTVTIVNAVPIGSFDSARTGMGEFTVKGWSLDPDVSDSIRVHVYVDGKATTSILADQTRQDVANAYGKGAAHGFEVTLPGTVGDHEVCLYGIDTWGGKAGKFGCRTVAVNGMPYGALDAASASRNSAGDPQVRVQGWAIDPNTRNPITVHVIVDGTARRAVLANVSRPDVDAAHGMGPLHGFDSTVVLADLTVGQHQVCVNAIDSFGASMGGVNPQLGCQTVTVN